MIEEPLCEPSAPATAPRTMESLRPAQLREIPATGFFGSKPMLKRKKSLRKSLRHRDIL
jgi:hypothetical protein